MNDNRPDNRDIEDALRASLERHARQAPSADLLAERVIRESLDTRPARPRRWQWGTWALPALASGAVAAAAVAVLVATNLSDQATGGHPDVGSPRTASSTSSTAPSSSASVSQPAAANTVGLVAFRAVDLTFVSPTHGWAMGTASCTDGKPGRCSAMVRTTDGTHWTATKNPPADIGELCTGANACVDHVRFATDKVGYAFGESAFFLTTDGGATWKQQAGGAAALESLDSNVIRITSSHGGCPGPCDVGVETAAIGSTVWRPVPLPGGAPALSSLSFVRGNGGYAYLLAKGHPAGGANNATSTLYRTKDNGATWTKSGEPCPQSTSGEVDSFDVAGGAKGAVAVLCATRQAPQEWVVATSTDGGSPFARQGGAIPADRAGLLTGDPATELVVGGPVGLSRSTDRGASWAGVGDVSGTVTFVGFESPKVGRCVTDNGRTIWTTHDGGLIWSAFTFPG